MNVRKGLKNCNEIVLIMRSLCGNLSRGFCSGLDEHNRPMVELSCGGSFLYKTPEEAWELFEHLSENSHLHATSSHSDLPKQLGSKRGIYEVSH